MKFTGSDSPRLPVQYGFVIVIIAGVIWAMIEARRTTKKAEKAQ